LSPTGNTVKGDEEIGSEGDVGITAVVVTDNEFILELRSAVEVVIWVSEKERPFLTI
jgi:hypothetical protein